MKAQLSTGIVMAYNDSGAGARTVLFIHGFPHDGSLWAPQFAALAGTARCIAPDLRGFGESDVKHPFSMDQYADDLAALLDELRVDRCVVAGLSMGGYIAFNMWRRHRDRIEALVLADTRAGADSEEGRAKRNELIELTRAQGVGALADAQIQGMVGKTTREQSPDLVSRVQHMLASAPAEGVVGALAAMRDRADSSDLLDSIDVPVLILVGEEDVLTPPRESEKMHAAISRSTLETIPAAGHLSNVERSKTFNDALQKFLAIVTAG